MEVKLNPSLITWGLRRLCPPMNWVNGIEEL
jgi:hypothetical protein